MRTITLTLVLLVSCVAVGAEARTEAVAETPGTAIAPAVPCKTTSYIAESVAAELDRLGLLVWYDYIAASEVEVLERFDVKPGNGKLVGEMIEARLAVVPELKANSISLEVFDADGGEYDMVMWRHRDGSDDPLCKGSPAQQADGSN
jgi:hypothetical protein